MPVWPDTQPGTPGASRQGRYSCAGMSIRDAIIVLNQMRADGVIERYAIGGAVGATFYLEPVATLDVDVS